MDFLCTLYRRCRTNSEPKHLPAAGSRITQTVAHIAACGLVFSSAGFAALFAWTTGIEHGWLLASLMVTMAVGLELAKPLAVASAFAAFRGWGIMRGTALTLLALVAIAYSLTAELQLIAMSRGDLVAKREAVIEQRDDRRETTKSARAELASLASSRSVAEVQADITKLLADNPRAGDCARLDGPVSRSVCPQVAVLKGEIERAERRAKLGAVIAANTGDRPAGATVVKSADPGSSALATYLATVGLNVPAGKLTDWLVLVPVFALELGAALSVLLVQSVSGGQPASGTAGQQTVSGTEQKPDTQTGAAPAQPDTTTADAKTPHNAGDPASKPTENRTPKKPKKRTRGKGGKGGPGGQSGRRRLGNVVDLLKARGGQLKGGQRQIAKQLRMSKSLLNETLHELAAAGAVKLNTSRSGTVVQLAA